MIPFICNAQNKQIYIESGCQGLGTEVNGMRKKNAVSLFISPK